MTNRQTLRDIILEAQTLLEVGEDGTTVFDLCADEEELNKAFEALAAFGNRIAEERILQAEEYGVL